ncbi:MAG: hypothetical protein H8D26_03145 [Methanomicrobia archaeon]|nr:hypothetical protein [Methanomicrobia archaeon]
MYGDICQPAGMWAGMPTSSGSDLELCNFDFASGSDLELCNFDFGASGRAILPV